MRGGARKGTGPKHGPGGKRIDKNIALTADVWAFVTRDGETAGTSIEKHYRVLRAFKAWIEASK